MIERNLICSLLNCGYSDLKRLLSVVTILKHLELEDEWLEILDEVKVNDFNSILFLGMELILNELGYPTDSIYVNYMDSWYGIEELDEILWKENVKYEDIVKLRRKNTNG